MDCPKCSRSLRPRMLGTVEVDDCPSCRGTWFDGDELRKAKDEVEPDAVWLDFALWRDRDQFKLSAKRARCPRCQTALGAISYGMTGVEVDYCTGCHGVWLDSAEFKGITEALNGEISTKSVPEYIRASLAEALEIFSGPEGFASEWRDFLTVVRLLQYRIFSEHPELLELLMTIQRALPR